MRLGVLIVVTVVIATFVVGAASLVDRAMSAASPQPAWQQAVDDILQRIDECACEGDLQWTGELPTEPGWWRCRDLETNCFRAVYRVEEWSDCEGTGLHLNVGGPRVCLEDLPATFEWAGRVSRWP